MDELYLGLIINKQVDFFAIETLVTKKRCLVYQLKATIYLISKNFIVRTIDNVCGIWYELKNLILVMGYWALVN